MLVVDNVNTAALLQKRLILHADPQMLDFTCLKHISVPLTAVNMAARTCCSANSLGLTI